MEISCINMSILLIFFKINISQTTYNKMIYKIIAIDNVLHQQCNNQKVESRKMVNE